MLALLTLDLGIGASIDGILRNMLAQRANPKALRFKPVFVEVLFPGGNILWRKNREPSLLLSEIY